MKSTRRLLLAALVVLSVLSFPAGTASAQACDFSEERLDTFAGLYNQNLDQVPGYLIGLISGHRIDVRMDSTSGERRFAAVTAEDGRITSFREGTIEDPTLVVETRESTLCRIVISENPIQTASDAYLDGDIEIRATSTVTNIMLSGVKAGAGIVKSIFG